MIRSEVLLLCIASTLRRSNVQTLFALFCVGGVSEAELNALVTANGWRAEQGGEYVFVANQEELVKSRDVKEHVNMDSIAAVVSPHCH